MPIYEFYCSGCHMLFNFLSRSVNTTKRPVCPRCRKLKLERQVSLFAMGGAAGEDDGPDDLPFDETRMERAVTDLATEAERIDENDPRQAAQLMRRFSKMTGMEFNQGVEEALGRMEAGEDPEQVEAEMGDLLEGEEDPFVLPGGKKKPGPRRAPPRRDKTLYEM